MFRRRQALREPGEVWLQKPRTVDPEPLGRTAPPCQESAEPPGQACPNLPTCQGSGRGTPRWSSGGAGAPEASPGTPLALMFKLRPSGALRGDEPGERSPFCLAPGSHAAVQRPCSN